MSGLSIFAKPDRKPEEKVGQNAVDAFLEKATGRPQGVGRLVFTMDATASRGPTWDMARGLTGDMIREATKIGRLELQLVYFRGGSDDREECSVLDWTTDAAQIAKRMSGIACRAGYTQISRALSHARKEAKKARVGAVVLIGDACESPLDPLDVVTGLAGDLKVLGTPVFAFFEGNEPEGERGFKAIAEQSGGAFARFNAGGVGRLGELLRAAAIVAIGGVTALEGWNDEASRLLLGQMEKG